MIACLVLAAAAAVYAAGHLAVDTDIERMLPSNVAWRQNERALDEAFPQNNNLLVAVIDARTPDLAEQAAPKPADKIRPNPQLSTHARKPNARDLRRFVMTRPVLDFSGLESGATARTGIRRLASELGFSSESGVRLRLTGSVALDDEQFATLREGALRSTVLSVVMVCAILFIALRSVKLVGAILVTLFAGFMLTAGFAALAIGSLNLISIAFGVLFIGLAVDFSIQFSIRYRDQRHRLGEFPAALHATAETIGPSLVLAAGATAIGFLSFVPTRYTGIQALGWIAGAGMVVAIALNFLLL